MHLSKIVISLKIKLFYIILYMLRVFLCCVIFLLSHSLTSFSQEKTSADLQGWSVGGGLVVEKGFITDQTFSSLPYSGITAGASIGVKYKSKGLIHSLDIAYTSGIFKATHNEESPQLNNRYANVNYTLLAQLSPATVSHLYISAGAGINVLYANRIYSGFVNSHTTFEFASSLSFATLLQYKIGEASNGFFIYDKLQVPVIAYLVQPSFGDNNLTVSNKASFYNKDFVSVSSFVRLKNQFGFGKTIDNKQQLSLNYQWDYYHLQKEREVRSAVHSIAIIYYHTL